MLKPTRLITVAALVAIASAVAIPELTTASPASFGKRQTLHFFSKETSFIYTRADGRRVNPPPKDLRPGDYFDATDIDFAGNHRVHARHWTASAHLHCVVQPTGRPACESQAAIGGSLLLFDGNTIVGGSGRYERATGNVASKDVAQGSDAVITIELH